MEQFMELVKKMRSAQKEYFRTRSKDVLLQSKQLEKEVDMMIKEISNERLF